MKFNYALLFLITVIFAATLSAQRRPDINERMKKMDQELNLSDEQHSKIRTILEDQVKEFRKLREESDGDREQMRERARKMMKDSDDKICEVLNPEQQKKYRKHQEERRKNRRERPRD